MVLLLKYRQLKYRVPDYDDIDISDAQPAAVQFLALSLNLSAKFKSHTDNNKTTYM